MLATIVVVTRLKRCWRQLWVAVLAGGPVTTPESWFYVDAFSAFHIVVLALVFLLSSAFAGVYFADEGGEHGFGRLRPPVRRAVAGFLGRDDAGPGVDNLGVMWVGMEATTLLTAFLISLHPTRLSLEAMWKYLIICSIGIAFAFMGTFLAAAAIQSGGGIGRRRCSGHISPPATRSSTRR